MAEWGIDLYMDALFLHNAVAEDYSFCWPKPGAEDWGRGMLLVSTNQEHVMKRYRLNEAATTIELPQMYEDDAISLLHKVSKYEGEGAKELVNSKQVNKIPLDIVR